MQRAKITRTAGFTIVELMVSSLLIVIFAYGAGNAYLNFLAAKGRGDAKLRLQADGTQATEQLAREIRSADSLRITGTWAAASLTVDKIWDLCDALTAAHGELLDDAMRAPVPF